MQIHKTGFSFDRPVVNVRLYGPLGARFGRLHRLAVSSVGEAVRALSAMVPGFEQYMVRAASQRQEFACLHGTRRIGEAALKDELPADADIRIAPVIKGHKRGGLFQVILGAVLIVAGAAINYFSAGSMSWLGTPMMQAGFASIAGGAVQMLSPQARGLSAKDSPENGASYNFNGPVNTQAQGNPIPIVYSDPDGYAWCGSAVASQAIMAEDKV